MIGIFRANLTCIDYSSTFLAMDEGSGLSDENRFLFLKSSNKRNFLNFSLISSAAVVVVLPIRYCLERFSIRIDQLIKYQLPYAPCDEMQQAPQGKL